MATKNGSSSSNTPVENAGRSSSPVVYFISDDESVVTVHSIQNSQTSQASYGSTSSQNSSAYDGGTESTNSTPSNVSEFDFSKIVGINKIGLDERGRKMYCLMTTDEPDRWISREDALHLCHPMVATADAFRNQILQTLRNSLAVYETTIID